jgi:hypothetical protein
VPSNGAIRAWTVRGATGPIALVLIHPGRGGPLTDIQTGSVNVPDRGVHRYLALMPALRGEQIGLVLGPAATVGVRSSPGALARRWRLSLPGSTATLISDRNEGLLSAQPGDLLRDELLLRIDYAPGAVGIPPQLRGGAAARASGGSGVGETSVDLSAGQIVIDVVRVSQTVAVDLSFGGRRYARIALPQLRSGGRLDQLGASTAAGNDANRSDVAVSWTNPDGRKLVVTLRITRRGFEALS